MPWCIETVARRPDGGAGLYALATSKLTGRVWDGHIVLVPEPENLPADGTEVKPDAQFTYCGL